MTDASGTLVYDYQPLADCPNPVIFCKAMREFDVENAQITDADVGEDSIEGVDMIDEMSDAKSDKLSTCWGKIEKFFQTYNYITIVIESEIEIEKKQVG